MSVQFAGKVFNQTTGRGLPNESIDIRWFRNGTTQVIEKSYKVGSAKTSADGSFSLTATIDSTFFKQYFLSVELSANSNYISSPVNGNNNFLNRIFYVLDTAALRNIQFQYYTKVFLQVKLQRVQSDTIKSFQVYCNFVPIYSSGYYGISGQNALKAKDTVITMPTAANIYSVIRWEKKTTTNNTYNGIDSLICTQNNTNAIKIDY